MNQTTAAIVFVWLGMVLAISFLEAPLKFRAPDVTIAIGLGIGRLVFRALNTVEVAFASALLALVIGDSTNTAAMIFLAIPITTLAIQLAAIRPRLTRRSDLVLAGQEPPASRLHHLYIVLEIVKVLGLIGAGVLLLNG